MYIGSEYVQIQSISRETLLQADSCLVQSQRLHSKSRQTQHLEAIWAKASTEPLHKANRFLVFDQRFYADLGRTENWKLSWLKRLQDDKNI